MMYLADRTRQLSTTGKVSRKKLPHFPRNYRNIAWKLDHICNFLQNANYNETKIVILFLLKCSKCCELLKDCTYNTVVCSFFVRKCSCGNAVHSYSNSGPNVTITHDANVTHRAQNMIPCENSSF